MALVSLCMIMKNEEDELPLVIASAAGLADEIVIYDTGSTDRSVALARELGATVIEGYWDDDFSRARNEALRHCEGDWILWLDADEAIHGDKTAFRARLASERIFDSYTVSIESIEGGGLGVRSAFHTVRVFRRQKCHWHGPIHEQIGLCDGDGHPATTACSELRILHRGYTTLKAQSKDLVERNMRIAQRALDDPEVDRSRALFDYGRTLAEAEDPRLAIAPLREAAETTPSPVVRRTALRSIFYVHLAHNEFDEASKVIEELREGLTKTIAADVLDVTLHSAKKDHEACLEAIDRLPFADTDEDGWEIGRASVAWAKAQALEALGRPGEAADALLDALRTHAQLDVSLESLVELLHKAGRSTSEIAQRARPESMPILVAMASRLRTPEADEVLASFTETYPDRREPLAAARDMAAKLDVPRAMWWSNRFRRAGLAGMCPLVTITRDQALEPMFRLLAAAGGYLSFRDQRLVLPARAALEAVPAEHRAGAIEQVHGISPELAGLLSTTTQAVQLSRRGVPCEGYLALSTRPRAAGDTGDDGDGVGSVTVGGSGDGGDGVGSATVGGSGDGGGGGGTGDLTVVDPGKLPLGAATVHVLLAEDVLSSVPHERSGGVLLEWARVLCDGGRLRLEVPNIEAVPGLLASGQTAELRRLLFGGRRFGEDGAGEANADAWSPDELVASLQSAGLVVEEISAGAIIAVSARRAAVVAKRATGEVPTVCVLVTAADGAGDLLCRLRALSTTDSGIDFETVVLLNGPDEGSLALTAALEGDVTTAVSPVRLDASAAIDEAARLARAETLVVLSRRARPVHGWLGRLVAPLGDPTVAVSCAAVVDERELVVHAGFDLVGDPAAPALDAVPRCAYLRAEVALDSDADVDAIGAEAFAVRRELWEELRGLAPGWSEGDAVIDMSLRARKRGLRCVMAAGCTVTAEPPDAEPPEEDAQSRERLAWHWAGRTALRPPRAPHVSASSLMPTSTLIERVSTVMAVPANPRSGGVNLVGDFEDSRVRSYAAALSGAGMRLSRLQWAGGVPSRIEQDTPFAYSTTLLVLDGDQLVDYVGEVGLDTLRSRRTIIAWEWPLAQPSASVAAEAAMVGEVWAPSSFAEKALKSVAPRPVFLVPPPIVIPKNVSRADAGLPDGFVFAAVARLGRCRPGDEALANPRGAIEAFTGAFPPGSGPVLSVVLLGRKTRAIAEACLSAAEGRPDVLVIETGDTATADAASVTADCLVSLHRSSSFGPGLALAMAVGCPVVATGYGGPMDFLSEEYAELVPYTITATDAAAYPFPAGTEWAEPHIDAAAAALRSVHEDYERARRKAWRGRIEVTRQCGPKAAARALRRRLGEAAFASVEARRRDRMGAAR
ncbi:MAG: glycosyltransferase [Acidimicrobiales bacterium]